MRVFKLGDYITIYNNVPAVACNTLVVNEQLMVGSDNVIGKITSLEQQNATLKTNLNVLLVAAGLPPI